jgi:hypothetical protein
MRNSCSSLIFASAFAYFAGIALVFLGYPPILNMHPYIQAVAFFFMGLFSLASLSTFEGDPLLEAIRTILAATWGIMAAFTFVGFVRWAPDGSAPYQLFMTAWDLVLAVCVLDGE